MVQSWNFAGIKAVAQAILRDHSLLIPHLRVNDISKLDYRALQHDFTGIVFDKDNCLTRPYKMELEFPAAVQECLNTFGKDNVATISNCIGCEDLEGATQFEAITDVAVIRHPGRKKPSCADNILKHFNRDAKELVVIGDRLSTDILMARKAGMFAILVNPITAKGDNYFAAVTRQLEHLYLYGFRNTTRYIKYVKV